VISDTWFYELLEEEQFDYVLTHHADDNIETFLINLSRGTGLDGLIGIPAQNDKIIRPLLFFIKRRNQHPKLNCSGKIVVMPQINIYEIKLDMI
jgi:tRNA(Ile)-lysidine synthase TilS/MesJ